MSMLMFWRSLEMLLNEIEHLDNTVGKLHQPKCSSAVDIDERLMCSSPLENAARQLKLKVHLIERRSESMVLQLYHQTPPNILKSPS